ncbi:MAG: hypothetical protein ACT4O1_04190 [Gemmatimonadota bacterium]
MRNLLVIVLTLSSVAACELVGVGDEDDASQPELIALERSAIFHRCTTTCNM